MRALTQFFEMSKRNKLFVAVVIAICFGVIEFTTHFFSEMPGMLSSEPTGQVVAVVQAVQTDVRQKPVEEKSWYKTEPQTEVMRGDAIYSGKSSNSQVRMKSGGLLELGEETLVIFDDVDGVTVPDVSRGKVRIKITGDMKIAISGQITDFSGSQSELELSADGTRTSIRTVKGKIAVGRKGASIRNLLTGQEMEIETPAKSANVPMIQIPTASELNSQVRISEKRKQVEPVSKPMATPVAEVPVVPPPPIVAPVVPVVEVAVPAPLPEPVKVTEALAPADPSLNISRIMKVQEVYQRRGKTALFPRTGMKYVKVPVALKWHGAKADEKIFVQVSKDTTFAKPWAEREATGQNVVLQEWKPGRNYWRVSRDQKTWTDPGQVIVKPTVAPAQNPSLIVYKNKVVINPKGKGSKTQPEAQAKLRFQDSGLTKARGWVLQGSRTPDFTSRQTRTVYVTEPRVDIPLTKPGKYFFRVRSVAGAGELSKFSGPLEVTAVKGVAPPVPIRMAQKPPIKERAIATAEEKPPEFKSEPAVQQTSKMKRDVVEKPDTRYRPWSVTIEGGETALVSSEQLAASTDPASMHVIGIRGKYNDGRNSVMGAYHSKFGAANAQGSAQASARLEGRYTRWWQTRWDWLRLGWAGGFSQYDNGSSSEFSKGYRIAKTGLGVDMTVNERWKTGGDILVGSWTDTNQLVEFGGFVSYDFSRELAFGVGYRVSLFEAGVASSTPISLPYREAMGEAYSSLKFAF